MHKHFQNALALGLFFHATEYTDKEIYFLTGLEEVAAEVKYTVGELLGENDFVDIQEDNRGFIVTISEEKFIKKIRDVLNKEDISKYTDDEKKAYIAGSFLACGNITDPEKSYHIEFSTLREEERPQLLWVLDSLKFKYKTTKRRDRRIIYCKDYLQLQDTLTAMGASKASLQLIDVEMVKSIRNDANRLTNCDTANINKTVVASTNQIADIDLVLEVKGKENLSEALLETARIRKENPYSSIRELTEFFTPTISRSGLHNRLSTFQKMAEEIRNQEEDMNV